MSDSGKWGKNCRQRGTEKNIKLAILRNCLATLSVHLKYMKPYHADELHFFLPEFLSH